MSNFNKTELFNFRSREEKKQKQKLNYISNVFGSCFDQNFFKMVRFSKLQLILSVLLVTALFLLLQLLFVSILKNSNTSSNILDNFSKRNKEDDVTSSNLLPFNRLINPKFNRILQHASTTVAALKGLILLSKFLNDQRNQQTTQEFKPNRNEYFIPLDTNKQPQLIHILPFNNMKNILKNLNLVQVAETNRKYEAVREDHFLNIESENRKIDADQLGLNNGNNKLRDNTYYLNIRGINKENFEFYKPDSNGLFKCLNSNVSIYNIYVYTYLTLCYIQDVYNSGFYSKKSCTLI